MYWQNLTRIGGGKRQKFNIFWSKRLQFFYSKHYEFLIQKYFQSWGGQRPPTYAEIRHCLDTTTIILVVASMEAVLALNLRSLSTFELCRKGPKKGTTKTANDGQPREGCGMGSKGPGHIHGGPMNPQKCNY
jgi:hypothetical protein